MPSLDRCLILIMHSEILGNDVEENKAKVPDEETDVRTIVLATLIAARTVTFDNMKYVIIHPAVRTASVHGSGSKTLVDQQVSEELEKNMQGRAARTCEGMVTHLYHVNDSELQLKALNSNGKKHSAAGHVDVASVIFGPPKRLYLIRHTRKHLQSRGFKNVGWIRTPDSFELDQYDTDAQRRVMMIWLITIIPSVQKTGAKTRSERGVCLRGHMRFTSFCGL
jgi:hypothetical protein